MPSPANSLQDLSASTSTPPFLRSALRSLLSSQAWKKLKQALKQGHDASELHAVSSCNRRMLGGRLEADFLRQKGRQQPCIEWFGLGLGCLFLGSRENGLSINFPRQQR